MISDPETMARILAERAMLSALGGGCLVPIGTTSQIINGHLHLRGMVLSVDGKRKVVASHQGPISSPLAIGQELAGMLINEGARDFLVSG
jgi:hydroxymethylbilane synthase